MNESSNNARLEMSAILENIGTVFESVLAENSVLWSIVKCIVITNYLPRFSGTIQDAELFMVKSYLITHGFIIPSGQITLEYFLKNYPLAGHNAPGTIICYRGNSYHDGRSIALSLIAPYALICVPLNSKACSTGLEVHNGFTIRLTLITEFKEVLFHLKPVSM
jgi:hypothetical protein